MVSFGFIICTQVVTYIANIPPRNGYSGGMATMDVYSFPNRKIGDRIAAVMWISSNDDINAIEAGWLVSQHAIVIGKNTTITCQFINVSFV